MSRLLTNTFPGNGNNPLTVTNAVSGMTNTFATDLIDVISIQLNGSVTAQSAAAVPSASISGNIFTKTAHGLITGVVGQMTTSNALPTGLTTSTNYWVITLSANTFALASSLANALVGTQIALSDAGTGTQTFTPTSASGVVALYESVDGVTFGAISGATATITGTATTFMHIQPVYSKYMQVKFTPTSGAINYTVYVTARQTGIF